MAVAQKLHMIEEMNTEIYQIKEEWASVRRGRKHGASQSQQPVHNVRLTFVLLFIATIFVFDSNRGTEIRQIASAKFHQVLKHSSGSTNLRQHVINYENQFDQITK
jgi:hypothetical protein